jgi:hypothetical protein
MILLNDEKEALTSPIQGIQDDSTRLETLDMSIEPKQTNIA